jgi:hypothetical protein
MRGKLLFVVGGKFPYGGKELRMENGEWRMRGRLFFGGDKNYPDRVLNPVRVISFPSYIIVHHSSFIVLSPFVIRNF